jgi:hypothetical protein
VGGVTRIPLHGSVVISGFESGAYSPSKQPSVFRFRYTYRAFSGPSLAAMIFIFMYVRKLQAGQTDGRFYCFQRAGALSIGLCGR